MSSIIHFCCCPLCHQSLEYAEEYSGQAIDCPACQKPITLPVTPFVITPKESLVSIFFNKVKDKAEELMDKRVLKKLLLEAVEDGFLTDEEILRIRTFTLNAGLGESEIFQWSEEIFKKAIATLETNNLSPERITSVEHIKTFLRLPDEAVEDEISKLDHFKYFLAIRQGNIPTIEVQDVLLRGGEEAYWSQPARLWERQIVNRRYEGGYSGMSFRIAKGVTIRTGGSRGKLVTDTADVPVAEGNFIITNKRLIFQGDQKSFDTKYVKIVDIHNHIDGIRYSETNKQKPRQIEYLSPNGDIIVEILSRIFSKP